MADARPVVLVTGLSGAGRSTALKVLEDIGYEAIDNLPLYLVDALLQQGDLLDRPLAVGIDVRSRGFSAEAVAEELMRLRGRDDIAARTVFLTCADEVLLQRFTETRRRHPLALDRPVGDGIARERQLLAPIEALAELSLDTTQSSIHDLRRRLEGEFALGPVGLQTACLSFSYRHGVPREADLLFDMRFVNNPHWQPELRALTGEDEAVAAFLREDTGLTRFLAGLQGWLLPLLPRYADAGKRYLTLGFGCTGGRHRSVFTAARMAHMLREAGWATTLHHRDLPSQPV